MAEPDTEWDVIVVGGALSGASTACLLRRRNPSLRVLILERTERFGRRVGESTVEIGSYFLRRVLGLNEHLLECHLPKQGIRFWAANDRCGSLGACSEIGPRYSVRLPGYQVDRAVLDEHVLDRSRAEGAVVRRGIRVRRIALRSGGRQTVVWEDAAGASGTCSARWVVDASGVAALLARQEGWLQPNREHPIAACWCRWTGVKSWDDRVLAEKYPQWACRCHTERTTATNHLTGYGWWAWWIPLKGGDVSVGVVFDRRITELPPGPSLAERLRTMLLAHPAARELFADARCREGDAHFRSDLAYSSEIYAVDGAVLVGDAAAFLDPFYSPGMDWIAFTASAAASLVDGSLRGAAPALACHNRRFTLAYGRWFRALYRDKYRYLGDHELMRLAFRLDLGLYYLGSVLHVYRTGASALECPSFARPGAGLAAAFMGLYNRRFAAIAEARRRRGAWGRRNAGRYYAFTGFEFNRRLSLRVLGAVASWGGLELREGWRTWFSRRGERSEPRPLTAIQPI
ncbi:MAG: NAD(P)/FAD-dependent oxidoreductase [Opitutaceae bacterium]